MIEGLTLCLYYKLRYSFMHVTARRDATLQPEGIIEDSMSPGFIWFGSLTRPSPTRPRD